MATVDSKPCTLQTVCSEVNILITATPSGQHVWFMIMEVLYWWAAVMFVFAPWPNQLTVSWHYYVKVFVQKSLNGTAIHWYSTAHLKIQVWVVISWKPMSWLWLWHDMSPLCSTIWYHLWRFRHTFPFPLSVSLLLQIWDWGCESCNCMLQEGPIQEDGASEPGTCSDYSAFSC